MLRKIILIVEDEEKTRVRLKKSLDDLTHHKYEIITAAHAQEAFQILAEKKVNLLISDIVLPEITGLEMILECKKKGSLPTTIVISSYSKFDYAQEAIELGVTNYLVKPISKERLVEAIEKALEIETQVENSKKLRKIYDQKLDDIEVEERFDFLSEALDYIAKNLHQQITLRDVAKIVHLNANYFSTVFHEQMGVKFSEYLTRSRIQSAKKKLLATTLPIEEIAESVGYQTSKYFIKVFKEQEGITPSKFRKSNK